MAVTNTTIDLEWTAATDNVGVVSYQIFRSEDNISFTEIHESDGVTLAYTATGLTPETQYYFKQTAKDAAGNQSIYGNTVTATTLEGGVVYTYLLDDYPGAVAAYSLQKLSSTSVQGIMVRRDSDDQLVDVRLYDDPDKSIDLDSITESGGQTLGEWVGSASAFVFNWYDQSGNGNHVTNSNELRQPWIINDGVLGVENALATINTYRGGITLNGYLGLNNADIIIGTQLSVFAVHRNKEPGNRSSYPVSLQTSNVDGFRYQMSSSSGVCVFRVLDYNYIVTDTNLVGSQELYSTILDGSTIKCSVSGTSIIDEVEVRNLNINNDKLLGIPATINVTSEVASSTIQEVIIYPDDQTTNRTAIEDNINSRYNIWVTTAEVDAQLIQADSDNVSDTVIEINGVRSSASDTAVANLISRGVTVITK